MESVLSLFVFSLLEKVPNRRFKEDDCKRKFDSQTTTLAFKGQLGLCTYIYIHTHTRMDTYFVHVYIYVCMYIYMYMNIYEHLFSPRAGEIGLQVITTAKI